MDQEQTEQFRRKEYLSLSPDERMKRFIALQQAAMEMMSPEGHEHYRRRNHRIRRVHYENGQWTRV